MSTVKSLMPDNNTPMLAIQASIISEQAVAEHILTRYAFGHPVSCRFHRHGVNDTYHVSGNGKNWYLRIYTPRYADADAIAREIALLLALDRKGLGVSVPVADRDMRYTHAIKAAEGQRHAVLFTGMEKQSVDIKNKHQMQAFGAWTAAFHHACDELDLPGVRAPLDTHRLVQQNLALFLPALKHRPEDAAFAKHLAARLTERLGALQQSCADFGIIHGDLHAGNAAYHPDSGIQVFDFADSGVGWRFFDLGVVLYSVRAAMTLKKARTGVWSSFIRGYRTKRKLDSELLDQAPLFVILKYFWLLGFHTTMGDRHGNAWMDDGYYNGAFAALEKLALETGMAE